MNWYYEIENLTIDDAGVVYWRGVAVERFSLFGPGCPRDGFYASAAKQLAKRCLWVESNGCDVTCFMDIAGYSEEEL